MKGCSPETARSIVDLLLQDPGCAGLSSVQRITEDEKSAAITEETCRGCDQVFMPKAVGRQFCSRACYNAYLERKRDGTLKPKRPRPSRENGSLGPGRRFAGEPYEYTIARAGLSAEEVQTELLAVFGLKVGLTTIFRSWRRHAAGLPAPRPQLFSKPIQPASPPSPPEPEAPMLSTETKKAMDEAQSIARRLKAVLARKGISQHAAGEAAGVSQTAVSKAYRGHILSEETRASLVAWIEFEEGVIPTKDVSIAQSEQLTTALGAAPQEAEEPREPALHTPRIVEAQEAISGAPDCANCPDALGVECDCDEGPVADAITRADLERSTPLSPADVMLEKIARRGALAELEKHGLELPDRARITISLEWGPAIS